MSARSLKAKGFTLVEILIVVVILGILAAIVIPQFTSASEAAKAASIQTQLQTVRSQIELFQIQHNGDFPLLTADADTGWDVLTEETDVAGDLDPDADVTSYGPYLQKPPVNGFQDSAVLTVSSATDGSLNAGADDTGWTYNSETGEIKAIVPTDKAVETGLMEDGDTENDDIMGYTPG